MKVYLAADHAGFELKEFLEKKLQENGYEVTDCGPNAYNEGDDYPDFVSKVAKIIAADPESRGIVLGGSGEGEAIDANREKGVRAAVYYGGPLDIVKLSREHNDANILSLGARFVTEDEAWEAVTLWLETQFSEEERHERRLNKLDE